MCQRGNFYCEAHAARTVGYKVVRTVGRPGRWKSLWIDRLLIRNAIHEAEGESYGFVGVDMVDGGAFHVFPTLATARRALSWLRPGMAIIAVAVSEYVCSGVMDGAADDYPTACYRRIIPLGEVA
jgi:hypothetical protein